MPNEVEIKFQVADMRELQGQLSGAGFRQITPPTHEQNTVYDTPGGALRRRGELLRLRKYGERWKLTHKAKGASGRHKTRIEQETSLADGDAMAAILKALGYSPSFCYEKMRSEWTDGQGHVVLDETPIGNYGEIEGPPEWIDRTAQQLNIDSSVYITKTYAQLFEEWKKTHGKMRNMTFSECGDEKS